MKLYIADKFSVIKYTIGTSIILSGEIVCSNIAINGSGELNGVLKIHEINNFRSVPPDAFYRAIPCNGLNNSP
ncbi:hypothetical protein SD960_11335 [Flavobacterium sp. MMLR14_040]|uniref:hypothetical protein n=1 Tax=Flavobacterium sp. MMLR14_040 TaxID=3093843 RepID=UPI00298F48E5|nr:hypothetical protein [Flavobacterium sp. MMLR14_040]MDW8850689.1 hypothetical protein [Flavobacterium sp. MMLR14_040]